MGELSSYPRVELSPERRLIIRTCLLAGLDKLTVAVGVGVSMPSVVRIAREIAVEQLPVPDRPPLRAAKW
jgi:hypothetical protein